MRKVVDLTGKIFGQLTVIERVKVPGENESHWKCKCSCGKEVIVIAGNLKKGQSQSCGCTAHKRRAAARVIDLTGKQFGALTVLYMNDRDFSSRISWHCKCECGNECDVDANNLTSGHTKSCGCRRKNIPSELFMKDLTGVVFGYLTVIEPVGRKNTSVLWKCECLCGNYTNVRSVSLLRGDTTSCGCRRTSYGEEQIQQILDKEGIQYLYNKGYFKDLFGYNNLPLRYDFILMDKNNNPYRLIEFDGPQHDAPQDIFGGEEKFIKQKQNDKLKNQYALSHDIPLVRIPYSKRDTMTIDDLFGDKYLIKGEC